MDGDALTTAATWASTSASAVIRSRSRASITTMSPGAIRRSSRSMSRSTRAVPVMPGRELAVRDSSADIFMSRFCRETAARRGRRAVTSAPEVPFVTSATRLRASALIRLEQLDKVAGRIDGERLLSAPAGDRAAPELDPGMPQLGHGGIQTVNLDLKSIPPTG